MIERLLAEAQRLIQSNQPNQAVSRLQKALQQCPADGRVHYLLAACLRDLGQSDAALKSARMAAKLRASDAACHYLLAQTLEDCRQIDQAIGALRDALRLKPSFPEAHHYLGLLLADSGANDAAIASFGEAIRLQPGYAKAWNNLGTLLRDLGRGREAEQAFRQAVRFQPDYAMAHHNLGLAQRDAGDRQAALVSLRKALSLQPARADTALALGNLLRSEGDIDSAISVLGAGRRLDRAGEPRIQLAYAFCLGERGECQGARDAYSAALASSPRSLRAAIGRALTLPTIYPTGDELDAARQRYERGLDELTAGADAWSGLRAEELLAALQWSNFYLAYQGRNDRILQEKYAEFVRALLSRAKPEWLEPPKVRNRSGRRMRIGFASSFFTDSTVGHYFCAWITGLAVDSFEVFVYSFRPGSDPVAARIASAVASFQNLAGRPVPAIVEKMREDRLDVLVFPELGMDSTTFLLAAMRIAPVQCAAWGHPVTSGHRTIDYFLSVDSMEPAGAEAHYTETLRRLPGIGTCYGRPQQVPEASRTDLGLPESGALMLVPQSLFKIHPDNDALMVDAMRQYPAAHLVLFSARHQAITDQLLSRLAGVARARGLESADRIVLLPYMPRARYLQVNRACDVMLDTLHWSGGNTSLDALSCGLPMVTLPGEFMRGRQSAAMLETSGAPDLVVKTPDEYLDRLSSILSDAAYRNDVQERLRTGVPRLFDDRAPVELIANWLAGLSSGE